VSCAVIVMVGTAQRYSPQECKTQVREAKQAEIARRIDELRKQRLIKDQSDARQGPDIFGTKPGAAASGSNSSGAFGGVFAPSNLSEEDAKEPETPAQSKGGSGAFGGVFAPTNLDNGDSN